LVEFAKRADFSKGFFLAKPPHSVTVAKMPRARVSETRAPGNLKSKKGRNRCFLSGFGGLSLLKERIWGRAPTNSGNGWAEHIKARLNKEAKALDQNTKMTNERKYMSESRPIFLNLTVEEAGWIADGLEIAATASDVAADRAKWLRLWPRN
jgi:hypothetical protein